MPKSSRIFPVSNGCGMSVLVGTGNVVWSGLYVISSIVGFITLTGLMDIYYVNRFGIIAWWYKGLLFLVCMVAGVFAFGGLVVFLWYCWEKRTTATEKSEDSKQNPQSMPVMHGNLNVPQRKSIGSRRVIYGKRPNFRGILHVTLPHFTRKFNSFH